MPSAALMSQTSNSAGIAISPNWTDQGRDTQMILITSTITVAIVGMSTKMMMQPMNTAGAFFTVYLPVGVGRDYYIIFSTIYLSKNHIDNM